MAEWSKEVFAQNLQTYMNRKGVNQKDLAEAIGVSCTAMNEWLKSKKYPRIDKIERLADYFGILKSDLIEDKTEMDKKNDAIADIIVRLRSDNSFLSFVQLGASMSAEELATAEKVLQALTK